MTDSNLIKATTLHGEIHAKNKVKMEPNTFTDFYSVDDTLISEINVKGKHRHTNFLIQTNDYSDCRFGYSWNSLGLRCPEPDYSSKNKILYIGNSMTLGQGVPMESSYAYLVAKQLKADYINSSEWFVLLDSLDTVESYKAFKPGIIFIAPGRFMSGLDMLINYSMLHLDEFKNTNIRLKSSAMLKDTAKSVLKSFYMSLESLFPNAQIYWLINQPDTEHYARKDLHLRDPFASSEMWEQFKNIIEINPKEDYVDLGRDNIHPGPRSHYNISKKILSYISQ